MRRLLITALLLSIAIVPCRAGNVDMARFPFLKDLAPPAAPAGKIGSFVLDDELLESTVDACANLRIVDAEDAEVPFLVRDKTETRAVKHERRLTAKTVSLESRPDNSIELVVQRGKKRKVPVAVVLETRQRNYEKTVSVYGSNDRKKWHVVAKASPIFDYSKHVDLQNNRIDISGPSYEYYKFEIANILESHQSPLVRFISETRGGEIAKQIKHTAFERKDFRIEEIVFIEKTKKVVKGKTVTRSYRVWDMDISQYEKKRITIVAFRTVRAPIRSIRLLTDSPNFSRSVTVEARDHEPENWRRIASATLSRIDLPSIQRDYTNIVFGSACRYTEYRLKIHNMDNPVLDVRGVDAVGDVREILFFSKPDVQYRAVYGAADVRRPSYDIASVVRSTVVADTDIYVPGPQKENDQFDESIRAPLVGGRTMLVVAVLLMVLALTWLIAKSVKGIDALNG